MWRRRMSSVTAGVSLSFVIIQCCNSTVAEDKGGPV